MTTLTEAHQEWLRRSSDEQYVSLTEMRQAAQLDRRLCQERVTTLRALRAGYGDDGSITVSDGDYGATASHYAFSQLSRSAGAPADYLRRLPAPLAAMNLAWGLEHNPDTASKSVKLLTRAGGPLGGTLRAVTGQGYGRVWDEQVAQAVERLCEAQPHWQIPGAFGRTFQADDRRATTVYRGDRSSFIFLADDRPLDVGDGRPKFKGVIVGNSEVGARSLSVTSFYHEYMCANHIIWGVGGVGRLRIVHRGNAPERFVEEVAPALLAYATADHSDFAALVVAAQRDRVVRDRGASPEAATKQAVAWIEARGFSAVQAQRAVQLAEGAGYDPRSRWGIVQGLTEQAHGINHIDDRIDFEQQASALLQGVGS